jgi:hypothetical protein
LNIQVKDRWWKGRAKEEGENSSHKTNPMEEDAEDGEWDREELLVKGDMAMLDLESDAPERRNPSNTILSQFFWVLCSFGQYLTCINYMHLNYTQWPV